MLFEIPLFLIILVAVFYLPGRFLLRQFSYNPIDFLSTIAMSLGVGIAVFLTGTYLLSWIHFPVLYNLFVIGMILLEGRASVAEWKEKFSIKSVISPVTLLILLGSVGMWVLVATSGIVTLQGMVFYSVNSVDSIYHLSLINSILQHFPPDNPSISRVSLHGYHILYDFLIAQLVKLYNFNTLDLFFRLFPAFMSIFYGVTALVLTRFLKFTKQQSLLFLFLLYFAQGSRVLLPIFLHVQGKSYDPIIVQSLSHIFDPSVVLSMSLLFLFTVTLLSTKKLVTLLIPIVLLGVLGGMKVYTAILGYAGLGVIMVYFFIKERKFIYGVVLLGAAILSALFFVPFNWGVGKLIFAPFLLYKHFMESNQIFSFLAWPLKYQVYEAHNNIVRLIQLYTEAVSIFLVPSLGIRLAALIGLPRLFHKNFYTLKNIFFTTVIVASFLLGSMFIQNIEVFNIVQFLWLGYILLLIPTAYILGQFAGKSYKAAIFIWIIVLLLSAPDTVLLLTTFSKNPTVLSPDLLLTVTKIQQSTNVKDGIMVIDRQDKADSYSTTIFSALSNRPIYYQTMVLENVPEDLVRHRRAVVDMFADLQEHCDISRTQGIQIILQREDIQYLVTVKGDFCSNTLPFLHPLYKKGKYRIYKII